MSEKQKIKFAILFPLSFMLIIWFVYFVFWFMDIDMSFFGIIPQKFKGLLGIVLSPFAHGSLNHLASNSISFIILCSTLFYFYRLVAYRVFFINWLISGFLLWIGGRESVHIGASGLIYGLAFFIFFSGVLRRDKRLGAISMIVVLFYGSMVWGMLPQQNHISWEGHLFGAMSGLSLAWYYRKHPIDFIAESDGSSVSVSWGQFNQYEYEYIEDEPEEISDSSIN